MRSLFAAALALLLACVASPLAAQEPELAAEFMTPAPEQVELYELGLAAFRQERWEDAVAAFRASLRIRESNLTWLNLGRALFRAGRCAEASDAYGRVADAPQVQRPSPVEVLRKLQGYRAELSTCPGQLTVRCARDGARVRVDGGEPQPCPLTLALPPGRHDLALDHGDPVTIDVAPLSSREIFLKAPADEGGAPGWLWGVGAGALAGLGVGVGFDLSAQSALSLAQQRGQAGQDRPAYDEAIGRFEDHRRFALLGYGVAGASLLTGALLWWLTPDPDPEPGAASGLRLLPHGLEVRW